MKTVTIVLISIIVVFAIIALFLFIFIQKKRKQKMLESIKKLDIRKNELDSTPVLVELSKIEEIAKNEQLEGKINEFKLRYEEIKNVKIVSLNDMIVSLDRLIEEKNVKEFYEDYSRAEISIEETEYAINQILYDIDEIASCEEKYRDIITKLKAKYRFLQKNFEEKENFFGDLKETIKMQFENIEKRFSDFDIIMEEKLYNEITLVVNAIDTMIDHLEVVINELPDILLLVNDLIPKRVQELKEEYQKLVEEGLPLGYLNFDYNMQEVENHTKEIVDRAKVLNIDDSLFDLRNILEYLDDKFKDFEIEKVAKREFEQNEEFFNSKVKKNEKIIKGLYEQMDDIKTLYGLSENDLEVIDKINLRLAGIIKDYKALSRRVKKMDTSYMKSNIELYSLIERLTDVENDFDKAIKSLGSIYDDEQRAKEQLTEIKNILHDCKKKVRKYHLPIILDNYFVELNDVNDAIVEIEKELNCKPIVIKTLNIRVDTGRDLAFKLYATTSEMIKKAYLTEVLLVYANRYRGDMDIDRGLAKTEMLYFKGEYDESYNLVLKVLELKEKGVSKKVLDLCNK